MVMVRAEPSSRTVAAPALLAVDADGNFWHKADIGPDARNVRFQGENRRPDKARRRLLHDLVGHFWLRTSAIAEDQSEGRRRELSQIIKDVGGCVIVCVFIRAMHSHAVTLSAKAH